MVTTTRTGDVAGRTSRAVLAAACAAIGAGLATPPVQAGPVTAQAAIAEPLPDLTADELARFLVGKQQYMRDLPVEEGLGPIFNQTACGDCHLNPVGATGTQKVFRAGFEDKFGFDPLADIGGPLFQLQAISDECREDPSGFFNVSTDRVTNGMTGYGLVEAIEDCDILAARDAQPPAIQGTAHMVAPVEPDPVGAPCDPETLRVGRFGWKAQVATILTFSADASVQEMGLTNEFFQADNDPNGINPPSLGDPDFCDTVADPEDNVSLGNGIDRNFIDVVTDFQRFMTNPPQTPQHTHPNPAATSGMGMSGEEIFNSIGCNGCHIPSWTTSSDAGLEAALRSKVIRPYSDFLVHGMGLNGDGIPDGDAGATQLKTPPLWGLWQRQELWHSGIFSGDFDTRVTAAIDAHDDGIGLSQGEAAAQAFAALPAGDKTALLAFLASLGRREFDLNRDDLIRVNDFAAAGIPAPGAGSGSFRDCFGGGPYSADDPCAIHDVDQDTDVDMDDFAVFMSVYQGLRRDCNENAVLDFVDILNGGLDVDDNGILDECEPTCTADANGDADVGISEFMGVLGTWGDCAGGLEPCPYDFDGDGTVGIQDFLLSLGKWGACP